MVSTSSSLAGYKSIRLPKFTLGLQSNILHLDYDTVTFLKTQTYRNPNFTSGLP